MIDLTQVGLVLLTGLASFAGAWGGVRARLASVERQTDRAHERIDEHIQQHIEVRT